MIIQAKLSINLNTIQVNALTKKPSKDQCLHVNIKEIIRARGINHGSAFQKPRHLYSHHREICSADDIYMTITITLHQKYDGGCT